MATCDICEATVDESELQETSFGTVCPDCKEDFEVDGDLVDSTAMYVMGALGAMLPMLVSISYASVEAGVGGFSQTLTRTQVSLFWSSVPRNATFFVDGVAVIGGLLALVASIGLGFQANSGSDLDLKKLLIGVFVGLAGLAHLAVGLRFFLF
jgi:hypothetical protein